jgi:hypothetical protein
MKLYIFLIVLFLPIAVFAQFFSGKYVSAPEMEGFDHFEIKHKHGDEGGFEGIFDLHAFVAHQEMWSQPAITLHGVEADSFVQKYGEGKDILSVHKMKILWDGFEWEFFLLGYLDSKGHGEFIVVEELFSDETETELKEVKRYHWKKAHHLGLKQLVH